MNNFLVRTLSAVVFAAVMVFGIIWDRMLFAALFLFIMFMSLKEFYAMSLGQKYKFQQSLALLTACIAFVVVCGHFFFALALQWLALAVVPLMLIPLISVFYGVPEDYDQMGLVYLGLIYIALPVCMIPSIMMNGPAFDGWLLLSMMIIVWLTDVGAYCVGTLLGQKPNSRKLAPEISPKKSWWGFGGGVAMGMIAGLVLHFIGWIPFSLIHCVVIGLIMSVGGICGDLFESQWKRRFGVKDSGAIMPGHGGMLDRFDSQFVAIPLAIVYMYLTNLM